MPRALFVLTAHDRLGDTGRTTGWYLPEAAHPWRVLTDAGWEIDHVSPSGGRPAMDGADLSDPVQQAYLDTHGPAGPLTLTPAEVDPARYDAVLYVGGHGAMWDLPGNTRLQAVTTAVWERGGVVAAVCHGPAGLVDVRLPDGTPLVAGRRVAGFTNAEEAAVGLTDVVPFLLADRLAERGATHLPAPDFTPWVVTDGRLVTGQNPASAGPLGHAVLAAVREAAARAGGETAAAGR